jgi:hypothetical protein
MNDHSASFHEGEREVITIARKKEYLHQKFVSGPCLVGRFPNHEGWVAVIPYEGGAYDSVKYRVEPNGWDHEHCLICNVRICDGDSWWVALPLREIGLCEECHAELFPNK